MWAHTGNEALQAARGPSRAGVRATAWLPCSGPCCVQAWEAAARKQNTAVGACGSTGAEVRVRAVASGGAGRGEQRGPEAGLF